jgi:signal transduction histidine kinase
VAAIGQELTNFSEIDLLLDHVARRIEAAFSYHNVRVFLADEEAGQFALRRVSGSGAEVNKTCDLRGDLGEESVLGRVLQTAEPLLRRDSGHGPQSCGMRSLPDVRVELAVPLLIQGRVVGVLDALGDDRGASDEEELAVLEIIASQVAMAIQNTELFRETAHRYRAMIALHETSLDMLKHLDLSRLLEALLRRGVELLGAEEGGLYLCDKESGLVRHVAGHNRREGWVSASLRLGEGITGEVTRTGKPLILDNYNKWPGRIESCTSSPNTRVISVPLEWRQEVIGAIVVRKRPEAQPYNDKDSWLLSLFADLAVLALRNAELHTQVKELNRTLEQKVKERTDELARAKREIMLKAEQLRSLLHKTLRIQEEEQKRIARDMHDGVVQLITAACYELQAGKTALGSQPTANVRAKIDAAREVLREIEQEIRLVIHDLRPPILDAAGLIPALHRRVKRVQEVSGIRCSVNVQGEVRPLPPSAELGVFRVVEGAMSNVACHSQATSASVTVRYQPGSLQVVVEDDGRGFDYGRWVESHDNEHLGLLGMRERIERLGGEMDVWSKLGQGSRLVFRLSIEEGGSEGNLFCYESSTSRLK